MSALNEIPYFSIIPAALKIVAICLFLGMEGLLPERISSKLSSEVKPQD